MEFVTDKINVRFYRVAFYFCCLLRYLSLALFCLRLMWNHRAYTTKKRQKKKKRKNQIGKSPFSFSFCSVAGKPRRTRQMFFASCLSCSSGVSFLSPDSSILEIVRRQRSIKVIINAYFVLYSRALAKWLNLNGSYKTTNKIKIVFKSEFEHDENNEQNDEIGNETSRKMLRQKERTKKNRLIVITLSQ